MKRRKKKEDAIIDEIKQNELGNRKLRDSAMKYRWISVAVAEWCDGERRGRHTTEKRRVARVESET